MELREADRPWRNVAVVTLLIDLLGEQYPLDIFFAEFASDLGAKRLVEIRGFAFQDRSRFFVGDRSARLFQFRLLLGDCFPVFLPDELGLHRLHLFGRDGSANLLGGLIAHNVRYHI